MVKLKYRIEGLDCPHCASKLMTRMAELEGVIRANVNFITERLTIEAEADTPALDAALKKTATDFSKDVKVTRL